MVLDPFFGSGTVGKVAERLGRKWIGIELSPEYVKIAGKKTAQKGLFGDGPRGFHRRGDRPCNCWKATLAATCGEKEKP